MEIKHVELPKIADERGSLSFMETSKQIPFDIKRVFFITDLKDDGTIRWEHAHFETEQALFCLRWSVTISFDDGKSVAETVLDKPNIGVLIPKMVWHSMKGFSDDCLMLVVASLPYDEKDYIRDYSVYLNHI